MFITYVGERRVRTSPNAGPTYFSPILWQAVHFPANTFPPESASFWSRAPSVTTSLTGPIPCACSKAGRSPSPWAAGAGPGAGGFGFSPPQPDSKAASSVAATKDRGLVMSSTPGADAFDAESAGILREGERAHRE